MKEQGDTYQDMFMGSPKEQVPARTYKYSYNTAGSRLQRSFENEDMHDFGVEFIETKAKTPSKLVRKSMASPVSANSILESCGILPPPSKRKRGRPSPIQTY